MPNIAQVLKDEIQRLARKEIRTSCAGLHKTNVTLKKTVADLKRRIARLESDNRRLMTLANKQIKHPSKQKVEEGRKLRITGRGIRALRAKLGLSQADFAKLLGSSSQSVWLWEQEQGRLNLREKTRIAIHSIKDIGAREAKRILQERK